MNDIDRITLVLHARQGRDRAWWKQMSAAFLPTSTVNLSWSSGSAPDFAARPKR
jgi:hypothetical protein